MKRLFFIIFKSLHLVPKNNELYQNFLYLFKRKLTNIFNFYLTSGVCIICNFFRFKTNGTINYSLQINIELTEDQFNMDGGENVAYVTAVLQARCCLRVLQGVA